MAERQLHRSPSTNVARWLLQVPQHFIREPLNATLNSSGVIASRSCASVRASLSARNSRGANDDPSGSFRANFTFHGHTSWEEYRQNRFEIALRTGARKLRTTKG
jgi:hypothetical protein